MRTGNRKPDPEFTPTERLFRRYLPSHFQNGEFTGLAFSLTNPMSVNRGKYSEASDAVFSETDEWAAFGVVSFQVRHIPPKLPLADPVFRFVVMHTPLRDNYSHSEICCHRISDPGKHTRPSTGVRKLLRTELSRGLVWEIRAASN
jgi:hypothetical protein